MSVTVDVVEQWQGGWCDDKQREVSSSLWRMLMGGVSPAAGATATYRVMPPSLRRRRLQLTLRQMVLLPCHLGWFVGFVYGRGGTKKISDNQNVVGGAMSSSPPP